MGKTYPISEPQLQTVIRATNRAQIWEGVIGLFVGLGVGSLMRLVMLREPLWILVCAGLGFIIYLCRRQMLAWRAIKDATLDEVRGV